MNQLKSALTYLFPILAVFLVAYGCKRTGGAAMSLCNHTYALCTSARCIPQPGNLHQAICFCDVEEGASMSTVPCGKLQPSTDANGIQTVYSTFSFVQYAEGKQVMKCPGGTPWTWCLNKRCTVDPANPTQAICLCDVVRAADDWITFGGDCDPSTCETAYWSGASLDAFNEGNVFLTNKLKIEQSPVKWCQIR